MNNELVAYYKCDKCGALYADQKDAFTCCDQRRFNRAEKISVKDYIGHVYVDNKYFLLPQDIDCDELAERDYVYATSGSRFRLDIMSCIESALDDHYDDAIDNIVDIDSLVEFVTDWVAKQDIISYYPDYSRSIILKDKANE